MRWAYVGGIALLGCTFVADIWLPVDYRVAANVSLIYVAALTTIFILLYGLRSNWRANHIGRTLFAKSIVLPLPGRLTWGCMVVLRSAAYLARARVSNAW